MKTRKQHNYLQCRKLEHKLCLNFKLHGKHSDPGLLDLQVLSLDILLCRHASRLGLIGNMMEAKIFILLQGLDDEYQEEGKLLGEYVYDQEGEPLQMFPVMVSLDYKSVRRKLLLFSTLVCNEQRRERALFSFGHCRGRGRKYLPVPQNLWPK